MQGRAGQKTQLVWLRRALLPSLLTVALAAGLAACSEDGAPGGSTARSSQTPTSELSVSPTPSSAQSGTPKPIVNDLAKLPLKRTVNAGPLTVSIEYNTTLPLDAWTPSVSKPIELSLTAMSKRQADQKIYLTKVSADITAYDASGPVDDSRTLTDEANINPGFIVTFPNTYNQRFLIPGSSEVADRLSIDFTYEFVLQVNKDKDGRNFSKQVATDTVSVPLVRK